MALIQSTPATVRKTVEIRPLPQRLGAEVICENIADLSPADLEIVKQAWLDHLVLLIRGQTPVVDNLVKFVQAFGEIDMATPISELPDGIRGERPSPYLSIVSNVKEKGVTIGTLGDGEVVWHTDMSYHKTPISASMLTAVEVPATGGRTGFINMHEALESLPAELQARLKTLSIKNDATYNSAGQIRRGMVPVTDVTQSPGVNHPAVRTHPQTGHNALYLGRRPNAYVNGFTVQESEQLLNQLWSHTTSREPWYHQWEVGDIVIWDNRCVMHRREPFDPAARRLMYRAQCKGTAPVLDPNASPAPHPRSRFGEPAPSSKALQG